MIRFTFAILGYLGAVSTVDGFVLRPPTAVGRMENIIGINKHQQQQKQQQRCINNLPPRKQDTSLNDLIEGLPDHFFALTFPIMGIMLSVSKNFGRLRMEERAWEQRVEEARLKRLREDPTLTEIELRRKEAALEWSAYGKPRMDEEKRQQQRAAEEREHELRSNNGRRGVKVMDRNEEYDDDEDDDHRTYRMTDDEVTLFEAEYGIDYDPYYDDPYSEDELPDDIPYNVDRRYGDRIYENGEIFYKDKKSGLFYRQGAKPRNLSFF